MADATGYFRPLKQRMHRQFHVGFCAPGPAAARSSPSGRAGSREGIRVRRLP